MGKIIDIEKFKWDKRRAFRSMHDAKLDKAIEAFLLHHFHWNLEAIATAYQGILEIEQKSNWDYMDLREIIATAFDHTFGADLVSEISKHYWYDPSQCPRDYLVDRCLTMLLIGKVEQRYGQKKDTAR